jgi:cardiolipin synthase A/B
MDMNIARALGRPACIFLFAGVSACASLPEVDAAGAFSAAPTVTGADGTLPAQQAQALLARRWARAMPDMKARAALEEAVTGAPLIAGNKVTLLFDGPQTMQAMTAAVAAATGTVNLETYIFDQDQVGMKFADLLIEKQRQGVAVNILYDSVGTIGTPRAFFERMRAAGIHLIAFNPVNPALRRGNWDLNNRDHRKLLVVDGKIGFTGGVNISSTYANSSLFRSRQRAGTPGQAVGWRDTHVRIEGPAVASLQWMFIAAWVKQQGGELPERDYFPAQQIAGDKLVRILTSAPDAGYEIYKAFVLAIDEARRSIDLTAAYFVPDQQIVAALCKAAARGVDVKLLLPGVPEQGMVFYAGHASYADLLECGVKIYQMQVAVLHAKTAVIDANWSTVGSANIDNRSFMHNYELNAVVLDAGFGRAMENAFNEDLRNARQITARQWSERPLAEHAKEWAARLLAYWL